MFCETNSLPNYVDINGTNKRHSYGKYICIGWNTNGFNSLVKPYNTIFKKVVIDSIYADFWIISESHCRNEEKIELDSYEVYHHNRKVSDNCRKGSGGIAVAVNKSVLESHKIVGIFKGDDGQLALKLQNQLNDLLIGVFGLYLPPDSYVYGQNAEEFFNSASVIWENMFDCDLLISAGDLNARTKELIDYCPEIDGSIPLRSNPDKIKNSHGEAFLTFLKDNRAVILNGRVTQHLNNFTFISPRGSSVPDYIFCPFEHYKYCKEVAIVLIRDLINELQIPRRLPFLTIQ